MLDFVNHYYEVTKENVELLRQMIKDEDIRRYDGRKIDVDDFVIVGKVLGNNRDDNPKCAGRWSSRRTMNEYSLKKVTTKVQPTVMIIE